MELDFLLYYETLILRIKKFSFILDLCQTGYCLIFKLATTWKRTL